MELSGDKYLALDFTERIKYEYCPGQFFVPVDKNSMHGQVKLLPGRPFAESLLSNGGAM